MLKKTLAALALATSLTTVAACNDRPQVIAVQAPDPKAPSKQPGGMTVNGQATLEVSPDCADLTITITADSMRPGTATKDLETKKQLLIAALLKAGVETNDVKLSTLSLDPVYEQSKEGWATLKIHTYRAQITVTATTRDFSKIADILDSAGQAGASSMSTQFRRSDMASLKKQVREDALKAAKEKAEQTAKTLGIKLGRITAVAENQGGYMWSATYFPQVANSVDVRNSGVALGGTLQPLTLDVTISYELATET
ncbi:MAG TPA: SIMPL domain-containing protein [Kofleriaceae bacterium]|nr:SIMPL domain-containing protein [Kofleriaceae bacterium]